MACCALCVRQRCCAVPRRAGAGSEGQDKACAAASPCSYKFNLHADMLRAALSLAEGFAYYVLPGVR